VDLGLEWEPVVAIRNRRPERLHLAEQHRAGRLLVEVGVL
jgi:hypothetical protein